MNWNVVGMVFTGLLAVVAFMVVTVGGSLGLAFWIGGVWGAVAGVLWGMACLSLALGAIE